MEGTIKSFDELKGFGFITGGDGKEYTFNQTAIEGTDPKSLESGVRVSFEVQQGARGPRAVSVKKL